MNQETFDALLTSCKDEPSVWSDQPDVRDYDFSCPHRFMPSHHQRLSDFADQVARNMSTVMSTALRSHYKMTCSRVNEEYAVRHEESENRYYVPLRVEDGMVGYISIPAKTAIIWITSMLGGICKGEVDDTREMSALENDLLLDLGQHLVESFAAASIEFAGPEFLMLRDVTPVPPEFEDSSEQILQYSRFVFERTDAEHDLPFSMIILSHIVEPVAGLIPPARLTPGEARERLLQSINEVDVPVEVRVDRAEVAVRDIATLAAGDILMLGKRIYDPVDVLFCKKVLFRGVLVQFDGRYGVTVQEFRDDMPSPLEAVSERADEPAIPNDPTRK
jgi:flagellar motor switch protein FliM